MQKLPAFLSAANYIQEAISNQTFKIKNLSTHYIYISEYKNIYDRPVVYF